MLQDGSVDLLVTNSLQVHESWQQVPPYVEAYRQFQECSRGIYDGIKNRLNFILLLKVLFVFPPLL